MARKPAKPKNQWDELCQLIAEYGEAARADEMRGGGDPADAELLEAQFNVARLKISSHITVMRRQRDEE